MKQITLWKEHLFNLEVSKRIWRKRTMRYKRIEMASVLSCNIGFFSGVTFLAQLFTGTEFVPIHDFGLPIALATLQGFVVLCLDMGSNGLTRQVKAELAQERIYAVLREINSNPSSFCDKEKWLEETKIYNEEIRDIYSKRELNTATTDIMVDYIDYAPGEWEYLFPNEHWEKEKLLFYEKINCE